MTPHELHNPFFLDLHADIAHVSAENRAWTASWAPGAGFEDLTTEVAQSFPRVAERTLRLLLDWACLHASIQERIGAPDADIPALSRDFAAWLSAIDTGAPRPDAGLGWALADWAERGRRDLIGDFSEVLHVLGHQIEASLTRASRRRADQCGRPDDERRLRETSGRSGVDLAILEASIARMMLLTDRDQREYDRLLQDALRQLSLAEDAHAFARADIGPGAAREQANLLARIAEAHGALVERYLLGRDRLLDRCARERSDLVRRFGLLEAMLRGRLDFIARSPVLRGAPSPELHIGGQGR